MNVKEFHYLVTVGGDVSISKYCYTVLYVDHIMLSNNGYYEENIIMSFQFITAHFKSIFRRRAEQELSI